MNRTVVQKKITIHDRELPYTLALSSRARVMRLSVYHDGALIVTAPHVISEGAVERFIMKKARWIVEKLEYFRRFAGRAVVKVRRGGAREFAKQKEEALLLAESRVAHFNAIYRFVFTRIVIRNQKTRWGSCSKKGTLSFNYRILHLPPALADYIIVHELCHLGEFNHSHRFWDLVARTVPDYKERRRALRQNTVLM